MTSRTQRYEYSLQVVDSEKPVANFFSNNAVDAFNKLGEIEAAYPGKQIVISRTTTIAVTERVVKRDLERDMDKQAIDWAAS